MRRTLALIVLPILAVASLSACAVVRGPQISQDRPIEDAHAVVLESSGDLIITRGEPSLTVTASSTVIDRLTSEIDGGVLYLGSRGWFGVPWGEVRYELSLPTVEGVTISGSGDVEVDFSGATDVRVVIEGSGDVEGSGIDASSVTVSIAGSGDVELSGSADTVEAAIAGSGDIDLSSLIASDAIASINGSGDIRVHATGSLDAEINGAGSIRYSGDPDITDSSINGIGDIEAE